MKLQGVGGNAPGSNFLVFPNPPALAAFNASSTPGFAVASVGVVNDSYILERAPSAALLAAADGVNVIAASAPVGAVWTRQYVRNVPAEYETAWFFDPTTGNDANTGTTIGAPLRTLQEWGNRVREIHQNVTCTLAAGVFPNGYEIAIVTHGFSVLFQGNVTSSAPDAIAATLPTVAGAPTTNAGAQRGNITATAGSFTDQERLRVTTGAAAGSIAYVTKVTTPGAGGIAQVSHWSAMANPRTDTAPVVAQPAAADSYVVDTLQTTIGRADVLAIGSGRIVFQDCMISPASSLDDLRISNSQAGGQGVLFYGCQVTATTQYDGTQSAWVTCQFKLGVTLNLGIFRFRCCTFLSIVQCNKMVNVFITEDVCFDGGFLSVLDGAFFDISNGDAQFVDGTSVSAITVGSGSVYYSHANARTWGLDNAYVNSTIIVEGRGTYIANANPSIPGTGTVGVDCVAGGVNKTYPLLPFENTTTTANNSGAIVQF